MSIVWFVRCSKQVLSGRLITSLFQQRLKLCRRYEEPRISQLLCGDVTQFRHSLWKFRFILICQCYPCRTCGTQNDIQTDFFCGHFNFPLPVTIPPTLNTLLPLDGYNILQYQVTESHTSFEFPQYAYLLKSVLQMQ